VPSTTAVMTHRRGELTDGILDQLAKYERAKTSERTRRGKLRKAREGKVIAGPAVSYGRVAFGFKYNEDRVGLVFDAERIVFVKRMFYMAGVEGRPIYAIKRALETEGMPTPTGKKNAWDPQLIRRHLLSDLYKPHTFDEIRKWCRRRWRRPSTPRNATASGGGGGRGYSAARSRSRTRTEVAGTIATSTRPPRGRRRNGRPCRSRTPAYRESGWM
jgi:recombinase